VNPKSAYAPRLTFKRITRRRPNALQEIAGVYARARASENATEELERQRQNGLRRAKHWLANPKHHVVVGLFAEKTLVGIVTIAHWKKSEYQGFAEDPAAIDAALEKNGARPSKTLMLEGLCVPKNLTKQGYGTKLGTEVMNRVEQICAKLGSSVIFSQDAGNKSARFAPGRTPVFLLRQPLKGGLLQEYYLLKKD